MDHPTMSKLAEGGARLGLALIFGVLLGLNRTARGKAVGPRTIAMVALGAALLGWAGSVYAKQGHDPSAATRVLQGLITGIGFLGAGVILHDRRQHVRGLTSAATIWFAAAMGGVIGVGEYGVGMLAAIFAVALLVSRPLEIRLRRWLRDRRGGPRRPPQGPRRPAEA